MKMNAELEMAWSIIEKTGANLFLTGKAGTGKTTFLKELKDKLPKRMVVLAPTGIAAINAGGVTIHSFFQLPLSPFIPGTTFNSKDSKFQKLKKEKIKIMRTLDLLVIDEISMVRADMLDAVDSVMRRYRDRNKPFGGAQLLMIGDLQQLPPVVKDEEWALLNETYETPYFFSSKALKSSDYLTVELKEVFRQQDPIFISLLNKIRENAATDDTLQTLNKRYIPNFQPPKGSDYIRLTTHNLPAQTINENELAKLRTKQYVFEAEIKGTFPESSYPADVRLVLKQGAQIMFIKNDPERRFFNGMIGEVVYVDEKEIIVRSKNDDEGDAFYLNKMDWTNSKYTIDDKTKEIQETVEGVFLQYPIRLAWAITIHKSQGLTFEHAIIDVLHSFAHGQTYVALSRCKTLEGMVLSEPLKRESIKSDWVLNTYLSDISHRTPTESALSTLENNYVISLLDELFDFISLQSSFNLVLRTLDEHFYKKYPKLLSAYKEKGTLFDNIIDVSRKFKNQYVCLLEKGNDITSDHFQERIHKAAEYFLAELSPLPSLCEKTKVETENKTLRTQFDDRFKNYSEELTLKFKLLYYETTNVFSGGDYLKVKANILLGLDDIDEKKAKSKRKKKEKAEKAPRIPTQQVSYELFCQGLTMTQIAEKRSLTVGTIYTHLASFVMKGQLDLERIVPKEHVNEIRSFLTMNPDCRSFTTVKTSVNPAITYDEIRIVMNFLRLGQ